MAKKNKSNFKHKKSFSLSLAVVGGLAPGVMRVWEQRVGGVTAMANTLCRIYTGFSPMNTGYGQTEAAGTWNPALLRLGLLPLGVGVVLHKAASRLGINRAIRQAGIPFISI